MKEIARLATFAFAAGMVAAMTGFSQTNDLKIGNRGEVQLTAPTRLGTTILKPGHYVFRHTLSGGEDYLVVNEQRMMTRRHARLVTGPEVARVPCEITALDRKVRLTELSLRKEADGIDTITEVRISGEGVKHLVALRPKA